MTPMSLALLTRSRASLWSILAEAIPGRSAARLRIAVGYVVMRLHVRASAAFTLRAEPSAPPSQRDGGAYYMAANQ